MINKEGYVFPDLEILMSTNAFGNSDVDSGIYAVGRRIINLLYQEKGTCPDNFNMGVGIKLYLFERINSREISILQGEIKTQISRYINDVKVASVDVTYLTPKATQHGVSVGGVTMAIVISLEEPIEGEDILSFRLEKKPDNKIVTSFII